MRPNAFLAGLCAAALLLSGLPDAASAQQPTRPAVSLPLVRGARVRVRATTLVSPLVANYLEVRGDTLVVFEEGAGRGIWSFALDQVTGLETSAGEQAVHRPYILRSALIGGGAGLVAGAIFASSFSPSDPDKEYSPLLTGLVGGAIGAGVGALIGSRFTAEGWTTVPLPRRMSLGPRPGGVGLSVRF